MKTVKERIDDYFDGVLVTPKEQIEHDILVKKVQKESKKMLSNEIAKMNRILNK